MIKLGPGNEEAAKEAVESWPDGLHIGGGINLDNAAGWLEAGIYIYNCNLNPSLPRLLHFVLRTLLDAYYRPPRAAVIAAVSNCSMYIAGAQKVIVTSWLFPGSVFSEDRCRQ